MDGIGLSDGQISISGLDLLAYMSDRRAKNWIKARKAGFHRIKTFIEYNKVKDETTIWSLPFGSQSWRREGAAPSIERLAA